MTINLNGQTIGSFLSNPLYQAYLDYYYQYHRSVLSNGFICGKTTMASSFVLCLDEPLAYSNSIDEPKDNVMDLNDMDFYCFIMDSKAFLNWKTNRLNDYDSGYDGARIVVLTSELANPNQLKRYHQLKIPYLICGKTTVDPVIAIDKIKSSFGLSHVLLEGGPTINSAFLNANLVDTISLVVLPDVNNTSNDALSGLVETSQSFHLKQVKKIAPDGLHLIYLKKNSAI